MPIKKAPLGTYALPIKRIGAGKSDYEINLNFSFFNKKHEWQISAKPFSGFVGLDESKIVRLNLYNPLINNKLENSVCDQESILELRKKLSKAISVEDYETAAKLRDKINITEKH